MLCIQASAAFSYIDWLSLYTYIPQVRLDKLNKKAAPGIFIGYRKVSKAYKIFQHEGDKIFINNDVHFMENKRWD